MKQRTDTLADRSLLVLKGIAMGAANKVPGVSGGVVAFVAGFYEEFIFSLKQFNRKAFQLLRQGEFRLLYRHVNGPFLLLLITGMVISYFSVSKILDYFIIHYELYVWSCFFGMIIGSVYYIAKDFKAWNRQNIFIISIGVLFGIVISTMEPAVENDNLWFVFVCGIIGVSGMTLPGLSGSFILMLLGNYVLLLVDSVNALFDVITFLVKGDFSFWYVPETKRLLKVLTVFSLGSIVGLISLSHLLSYVLNKFREETFAMIIGFIAGSLGVVWPWKNKVFKVNPDGSKLLDHNSNPILDNYNRYIPSLSETSTYIALLFVVFGVSLILYLDWYGKRQKTTK